MKALACPWKVPQHSVIPLLCVGRLQQNSASAFDGFGDDESGFYQTYSRAFQQVWEAEQDWGDLDSSPDAAGESASGGRSAGGRITWGKGEAPSMGRGDDPYEVAEAFYSSWSSFASGLSFGWVDEYNVNEVSSNGKRRGKGGVCTPGTLEYRCGGGRIVVQWVAYLTRAHYMRPPQFTGAHCEAT